jgi:hypothetical protein
MPRKQTDFSKAFSNDEQFNPNSGLGRGTGPRPNFQEPEPEEVSVETIELVELSRIKPDYNQPRAPLLPPELHYKFWFENYDCFRVAEEWIQMAKNDPVMEAEVLELLDMGGSFKDDGQVNPVTGCWVNAGADMVFVLETGERRFWASVLYSVVNQKAAPLIRATVVKSISRRRQIMENIHQSKPGAVSQAREIAICILGIRKIDPQGYDPDPYHFVRMVNAKPIKTEELRQLDQFFQIRLTPQRLNQILKILELPTELLFVADHYKFSSRKLLEIYNLGPENWSSVVLSEAESQLALMKKAGVALESLVLQGDGQDDDLEAQTSISAPPKNSPTGKTTRMFDRRAEPAVKAMIGLRRFQKILFHSEEQDRHKVIDQIADEIVRDQQEGPELLIILEELATMVRARYDRM